MLFGFWHPYIFFHFYWKCFFISIVFFLNGVNIFCRLQKYWCKLCIIWNHSIINFVHQWRSVYLWIDYHSFSFADDVYCLFHSVTELSAVLQEVESVTVSTIHYSNAIIILYTMTLILVFIFIIIMYFLTNCNTIFRTSMFWVYKCACAIKYPVAWLLKMASNSFFCSKFEDIILLL